MQCARERAIKASSEYILPASFDDTEVPGLPDTTAYADLTRLSPAQLADVVTRKLDLMRI